MELLANIPVLLHASAAEWTAWLHEHHAEPKGVWLKIAKKGAGGVSVSYAEAVDVALCYGWIDGQKQRYDDQFSLQKFTPRRPRSVWSKINQEKVAALIAAGRMQPSGLKEVEAAKQDGRWDAAYASQSAQAVPEDLRLALEDNPEAARFFATLNKANRYAICWRIETAVKPATRSARVAKLVAMLAAHEKIHP